ncbi:MAG: PLP-dependent aminotransferase family protein, partial [Clostridia bacterium]|nr:PLP-dependent aminotransferase family protein [Clostridia bacterium]
CSSFSKILAPGMRVGFVCAHKDIISKMVVAKQVSDVHTPVITQIMANEYITKDGFDKHIEDIRELYDHKCSVMIDAIEKYFPKQITHTTPNGGLFIWCDLNGDYDMNNIAKICTEKKVACVPGSAFMSDQSKPCSAFRLNYSTVSDEKILTGIKILGDVFNKLLK